MTKLTDMVRRLRDEDSGAAMVEYSVLIGIVTVAAIGAILFVGGYVSNQWNGLQTALTPAAPPT